MRPSSTPMTSKKTRRYELGIAICESSHKMHGPYQDVLTWARELDDAATFMNRISRPGSTNDRMRRFVSTFRSHLREEEATHDDPYLNRANSLK